MRYLKKQTSARIQSRTKPSRRNQTHNGRLRQQCRCSYLLCLFLGRRRYAHSGRGKGEGPRKNWEKVQVLLISRGVEVVTRGLGPLGR